MNILNDFKIIKVLYFEFNNNGIMNIDFYDSLFIPLNKDFNKNIFKEI